MSGAPAQRWRDHRSVPELHHFIVQFQQGDRAARHFQTGDIGPDKIADDFQPVFRRDLICLAIDDIQFDLRRSPHAIDEEKHIVAALERQVLETGLEQHFRHRKH